MKLKNICDEKMCTGCMACYNVCPKDAIEIKIENGFYYPHIDENKCVDCELCLKTCPECSIVEKKSPSNNIAYAIINKNKNIRDSSSSGGVFFSLAESVLLEHGVVYGAAWTEKLEVHHIRIDKLEDISLLQGSKYVQSYIGSLYSKVKRDLEDGIVVLFSGVPCQISGLKSYLKKDYKTLYTCEVLCHGGSSPVIFAEHIKYVEKKHKSEVTNISFRYKTEEKCQNVEYRFKNGTEIILRNPLEDWYYNGFQDGTLLRDSCYQCKYIGIERCADITLADFWGLKEETITYPDKLTYPSLVFVNSNKGMSLFDKNKEKWIISERPMEEAVWGNLSLRRSVPENKWKKRFFNEYQKYGYEKAAKNCLVQHYSIKDIIKKVIGVKATEFLIKVLKR